MNGLAWTEGGGEVLSLEANLSHGRGLMLTGQLGDVMKESGQAALSYVRSILPEVGLSDREFSRQQIHVHVPAGATPKDGPSAGVAIATAIASLAMGIAVRADVAMTGEVTLRGRVLPVGGVREKALAALRSGITTHHHSREQRRRPARDPEGAEEADRVHPGEPHARSARLRARRAAALAHAQAQAGRRSPGTDPRGAPLSAAVPAVKATPAVRATPSPARTRLSAVAPRKPRGLRCAPCRIKSRAARHDFPISVSRR